MRQSRPKQAHRAVTPSWQALVEARLADQGMTRKQLAIKIGSSPAAITILLRPETKSSRLVELVSAALNIPTPDFVDERDAEVIGDMRRLRETNPNEYDRLAARARAQVGGGEP